MTTLNSDPEITVTETTSKKAPRPNYSYPTAFPTKKQILARIPVDTAFMLECFDIIQGRQNEKEVAESATLFKNGVGWMSSHAKNAAKLAAKKAEGTLDADDLEKMTALMLRYSKQLAESGRQAALKAHPELAEIAAIFSAN